MNGKEPTGKMHLHLECVEVRQQDEVGWTEEFSLSKREVLNFIRYRCCFYDKPTELVQDIAGNKRATFGSSRCPLAILRNFSRMIAELRLRVLRHTSLRMANEHGRTHACTNLLVVPGFLRGDRLSLRK